MVIYESSDQLIFSTGAGVFFYDVNEDKVKDAFAIKGDDSFLINCQCEMHAGAVPNKEVSEIMIYSPLGAPQLNYYYVYNIAERKLNRIEGPYPVELVDIYNETLPDPTAEWILSKGDSPMMDLGYKSPITGKTYWPLEKYNKSDIEK